MPSPAAPGPFLGHGLQVLLAPPLRLGPLVGPGGVSEGLSGRVRHHTRGQLHTGRRDAARHLLGVELELEADQRAAATATAFRVLLVDPQTQQFSQLGLNWLQYTLVQVAGAIGLRHVQQATELLKAHLPHAGLSILLQTAIRLLRVAGLQGRELGQFEARELAGQVVEQEREARVDRDQQFRGLPIGFEAGKQRELHRPAVILEPEPTGEQTIVDLNDSCR